MLKDYDNGKINKFEIVVPGQPLGDLSFFEIKYVIDFIENKFEIFKDGENIYSVDSKNNSNICNEEKLFKLRGSILFALHSWRKECLTMVYDYFPTAMYFYFENGFKYKYLWWFSKLNHADNIFETINSMIDLRKINSFIYEDLYLYNKSGNW